MLSILFDISSYLAILILLISVIILILNYELFSKLFKLLLYYLIWNLIIEVFANVLHIVKSNNLPLLHLYTLGEFIFLSYYFLNVFGIWTQKRALSKIYIGSISVLIILNSIFIESIYGFNSYSKTGVHLIIIFYAVAYLILFIKNKLPAIARDKYTQIINMAILIYYSGSLFIFMFSNYYKKHDVKIPIELWSINAVLNMIFQLVILYVIWKMVFSKTRKYSF